MVDWWAPGGLVERYQQQKKKSNEESFVIQRPQKSYSNRRRSRPLVVIPTKEKMIVGTPSKLDLPDQKKSTPARLLPPQSPFKLTPSKRRYQTSPLGWKFQTPPNKKPRLS